MHTLTTTNHVGIIFYPTRPSDNNCSRNFCLVYSLFYRVQYNIFYEEDIVRIISHGIQTIMEIQQAVTKIMV